MVKEGVRENCCNYFVIKKLIVLSLTLQKKETFELVCGLLIYSVEGLLCNGQNEIKQVRPNPV